MKKYLTAFLLSLSCAFAFAAASCVENTGSSSSADSSIGSPIDSSQDSSAPETEPCNVSFVDGEGFSYVDADGNPLHSQEMQTGTTLSFKIDLGAFYLDSVPIVRAKATNSEESEDDKAILPAANGVYSLQLEGDTTIYVEGVKKDVSRMQGTGAFDDAFLVTKPIDLVYIADQVNAGNSRYTTGAYILANDIDCKGEELKVIGDLSTDNSYFAGCFTCETDAEANVSTYHTISNFTINSQNANYVGLFGAVQANASVSGSGLFYGIQLDNFTINAGLTEVTGAVKTLAVGSLVGYGAGATMLLCNATNGQISISGENNYFSYAGGLIGYQQAFFDTSNGQYFSSEIAYADVSVDIDIVSGMTLYAGGISGYLCTNYPLVSVATIHNSIARGNVTGALRSGGIAGGLGQYSTVSNSYAVNDVMAIGIMDVADGYSSSDEYYYASAGGLIGYAENDSIVSDCFHNGSVDAYAVSGDDYTHINDFVGSGQEAYTMSPVAEKYIAWDCLKDIDLLEISSDGGLLKAKLGWEKYDWVFVKGEYPEINYETPEGDVSRTMTIEYVTFDETGKSQSVEVKGKTSTSDVYFDTATQNNTYVTMGSFFAGEGLAMDYTADNGLFSYGYFLDPECTIALPYAYMPIKNITLYVAFYDLSKVANTYYFETENGQTLSLQFGANGKLTYTDGSDTNETVYYYNGERIIIPTLRLARYYDGAIIIDENAADQGIYSDPNFDIYRYTYYSYAGTFENGGVSLYDGYYFTEDAPFKAVTTQPEAQEFDAFKGVWIKSANVQKTYTFDGKGNWSYTYNDTQKGTYEVIEDGNAIAFTHDGVAYKASFTGEGLLQVVGGNKTQIFGRQAGYTGVWRGFSQTYATYYDNGDFTLTLNGIGKDGRGTAVLDYDAGLVYNLVYEASETNGYIVLFNFADGWDGEVFGYFYYQQSNHTLQAVLTDPGSMVGYTAFRLNATDDYKGEWICNADDLKNLEFIFNGIGLSANTNEKATLTIMEDGKQTVIPYILDKNMQGSFQYKGIAYTISYNEDDNTVTLSYADKTAMLERKDIFASKTLIDSNGNSFVFDGRSNLTGGGKFTINGETTYSYATSDNGYVVLDNGNEIGSIVLTDNYYALTINETSYALYIQHKLNGQWAMRGMFDTFDVLYQDTDGKIYASFRGHKVTMTEYDYDTLTFSYMEGKMPMTYYAHIIDDLQTKEIVIVLSEYQELNGDDFIYCSKASDLFGTWTWGEDTKMTLTFDGVSNQYAKFYKGVAKQSRGGYDTNYYYTIKDGRILLESQDALQGLIWYYDVKVLSEGDDGYAEATANKNNWFNSENGTVIVRTKVDSLYLGTATDEAENDYLFDFVVENGKVLGAIRVNGEIKYTYVMEDVKFNNTTRKANLVVTDVADGKVYNATLDYSDAAGDVFILGEEVA